MKNNDSDIYIITHQPADLNFYSSTKIKYFPKSVLNHSHKTPASWKVISHKAYPRFPQILLPIPSPPKKDLFDTLIARASTRNFLNSPLSRRLLGDILYFSAGITSYFSKETKEKRFYPSAGGRYPLEIYPIIFNTEGVPVGIYHYHVKSHSLEKIGDSALANEFFNAVDQIWLNKSSVILVITAIFNRTTEKYGARGMRHVFTEYGHIAQNIYLTTKALGAACCSVGGFIDNNINEMLDLDPEDEGVIGVIAIGSNK